MAGRGKPPDDSRTRPPRCRVGCNADRLIDHDDGRIFIEDLHAGHGVGDDAQRLFRFGHDDVDPCPAGYARRLLSPGPVNVDAPFSGNLGGF